MPIVEMPQKEVLMVSTVASTEEEQDRTAIGSPCEHRRRVLMPGVKGGTAVNTNNYHYDTLFHQVH